MIEKHYKNLRDCDLISKTDVAVKTLLETCKNVLSLLQNGLLKCDLFLELSDFLLHSNLGQFFLLGIDLGLLNFLLLSAHQSDNGVNAPLELIEPLL